MASGQKMGWEARVGETILTSNMKKFMLLIKVALKINKTRPNKKVALKIDKTRPN